MKVSDMYNVRAIVDGDVIFISHVHTQPMLGFIYTLGMFDNEIRAEYDDVMHSSYTSKSMLLDIMSDVFVFRHIVA